jgi:hypothetical protein
MKHLFLLTVLFSNYCFAQITDPTPYCAAIPNLSSSYSQGAILNVSLATLNNSSGLSSPYIYYNNLTPPVLYRGHTYTVSVTFDSIHTGGICCDNSWYAGWIDFTHTNDFTTGWSDYILIDTTSGSLSYVYVNAFGTIVTKTGSFTVPMSAAIGITRMRIVRSDKCVVTAGGISRLSDCDCHPSTSSFIGETEDYDVNIQDASTTGLPEEFTLKGTIYPNPTIGITHLVALPNTPVSIRNVLGRLIYSGTTTASDAQADLSGEPAGIYFVNIDGQVSILQKQ